MAADWFTTAILNLRQCRVHLRLAQIAIAPKET